MATNANLLILSAELLETFFLRFLLTHKAYDSHISCYIKVAYKTSFSCGNLSNGHSLNSSASKAGDAPYNIFMYWQRSLLKQSPSITFALGFNKYFYVSAFMKGPKGAV